MKRVVFAVWVSVKLITTNQRNYDILYFLEARYAIEKRIPVIPCIMEKNFRPKGGLGIIKNDLKHIEFFSEEEFEESMKKLINEIDYIERFSGNLLNISDLFYHCFLIQLCYFS